MSKLQQLLGVLFMSLVFGQVHAAKADDSSCDVETPPASASFSSLLGAAARIFPDGAAFPPLYTGCQTIWVVDHQGRARIEIRAHFRQGVLVSAGPGLGRGGPEVDFSPCPPPVGLSENDRRHASGVCAMADMFPMKGYPEACMEYRDRPVDSAGWVVAKRCRLD